MTSERLSGTIGLNASVKQPGYTPDEHGHGIVHLGIGAFHRAHQAVYTDTALAASGGDWRIIGASLRGSAAAEALNPQNGLYTLIERDQSGTSARLIGAVSHVIAASESRSALIMALTDPATRIVSLTVTEKAYGISHSGNRLDEDHPAVLHDLENPSNPTGVLGYLVHALNLRRQAGTLPFTVLCCDNLPENGKLLREAVLAFAARIDLRLAEWICAFVSFPSTMVDRITPASTDRTADDAFRLTGRVDLAAVETEPFCQWVIEDSFCNGRPAWEAAGAIFVEDVTPYENMKLRMLNGTHSMMAYAGFLSDKVYVRDVMSDPALSRLVARHVNAASATLAPLAGIDLAVYAQALCLRFANPEIDHATYQIAMDGTQKLPQRIFAPALNALSLERDLRPFAFATAAWMRYCLGRTDEGRLYKLRDPMQAMIADRVSAGGHTAKDLCDTLLALPGLCPEKLSACLPFRQAVTSTLGNMLEQGMKTAIAIEVA